MSRQRTRNPKSLADLPVGVVEGLCLWGIYRALGFEADDIYAGCEAVKNMEEGTIFPQGPRVGQLVPVDCPQIIIVLKTQDLEFTVNYAEPDVTHRQFIKLWPKAATLWIRATIIQRRALIQDSWMYDKLPGLIIGLLQKGFLFPACDADIEGVLAYLETEWEA